ncbi:MAG: hypothetical protein H0U73_14150 [Tatlockia sp.]|nr:hypothetical protein [Tatlockia sp.]
MFKPLKILNKWVVIGLLALLTCQYAFADSLEGRWEHNRQLTSVTMGRDFKLQFCNEQGDCAKGIYRGKNFVFVPQWNVTGSINRHRNVISWSNGTQWIRPHLPFRKEVIVQNEVVVQIENSSVAGPWIHDGKPTTIQMLDDGIHFTLINEVGQPTAGYISGRKELVLPELHVSGRLHKQGRIINWSNGTTWYRPSN